MVKQYKALGIISGTALDGVDFAIITTDGFDVFEFGRSISVPYPHELKDKIRSILKKLDSPLIAEIELEMTQFVIEQAKLFLGDEKVDVVGFHGHTIYHNPIEKVTKQIGDGKLLAQELGIVVVNKFRNNDILMGGQGAPLSSTFYNAISQKIERPLAFVNIGGVSSVTFIGHAGDLIAFNAGAGNSAVDDWVYKKAQMDMDYNGKLAISGQINEQILNILMKNKYFAQYPPKAIDRTFFNEKLENLEGLSLEDGAATATAFCAEAISYSVSMFLPEHPKNVIICGGGAKNPTLVRFIKQRLHNTNILTAKELDFNIDAIEAQVFAFLAVRRLECLPASYPSTTGVIEPSIGGEIYIA
ncbi:MAG: anhydro-N-acetylmuramic acid kinase [Alphaproteobacteria bacterium]